eukprot:g18896.t1
MSGCLIDRLRQWRRGFHKVEVDEKLAPLDRWASSRVFLVVHTPLLYVYFNFSGLGQHKEKERIAETLAKEAREAEVDAEELEKSSSLVKAGC